MNTALWIVQILLALTFLGSGFAKAAMPLDKMAVRMAWVNALPASVVRLIGVIEVLGAIGLIVPALTGILPILTPIAAVGLAITMVGAMLLHMQRREMPQIAPTVVLLLLAAFVAYGRFVVVPILSQN